MRKNNRFVLVSKLPKEINRYKKSGDFNRLFYLIALLDIGKKFNEDGTLSWPDDVDDLVLNKICYDILHRANLLETARFYLWKDNCLSDSDPNKLLDNSTSEDRQYFFSDNPNPKYFKIG